MSFRGRLLSSPHVAVLLGVVAANGCATSTSPGTPRLPGPPFRAEREVVIVPPPEFCRPLGVDRPVAVRDRGGGAAALGYSCFVVQPDPARHGVVTLKNSDGRGHWEILAGTHLDAQSATMYGAFDYENNDGAADELFHLPPGAGGRYVIVAYSEAEAPSDACLVFHDVDNGQLLLQAGVRAGIQAFLEWMVSDESDSRASRNNKSRAVAAGMAAMEGKNLAAVGYDVALNEIGLQLTDLFGGGSAMFSFGMNYFSGYLEESGKYLYAEDVSCEEGPEGGHRSSAAM